ncbi:MAG: Asp-tRNA(Asn)/Glu-tRNA(Gln) amidotransferase subunit GatB [Methanomassiliicoccus sp.]|nr:Asp-tRNA(Asn)/Glu-tRNA(Gln) amidotransferase subunit GatB [Methanomassiliicoccus sp.]
MRIGLEIHVQLPTRSKLFCGCSTGGDGPNSMVCPVCLGFPGSRPFLNRKALEMGILITKFLNCKITDRVWFSRKTYFYPDLPKNFQITQYESALGFDGHFMVGEKRIGIWRVHIEEDPGRIKRVGRAGEEVSLIDYNRSGVPLVEIVTAPDLSSPAEARDFLTDLIIELRRLIGVSGEDQTMRVDANISVGEDRVEIKNITGLKNVEKGLKSEVTRQTKLLAVGKRIVRETRHYDESRGVTLPGREKEQEADYGYIGEPDLGTYLIGPLAVSMVVPETPLVRANRMQKEHGIGAQAARQIVLTDWELADLFESLSRRVGGETAMSWTMGPISSGWKVLKANADGAWEKVTDIVMAVSEGRMSDSEGRLRIVALSGGQEIEETNNGPSTDLDSLIVRLVDQHPEVVKDFNKGNEKAANFLIGLVMKETKGQFASKVIAEKMKKELGKRV